MRLILLLLAALSYDSPSLGEARAGARGPEPRAVPKRFARASMRQDDLGYLDQCSILQFWDKQSGRVNVLAFFDSSWPFSHRQASMLRILRERFDRTGFDNIQFFAINAAPGEAQRVDEEDLEVEEETWKQISPSEAEGMPPVVVSSEALIEALGPDIYFIQDTDELQIWPRLRAFRDQILVIDRCGRLTYQVIVPWSILHFPYVKAAILSTYKDEPCGYCQFQDNSYETIATETKYDPPTSDESSSQTVNTENSHTPSTFVKQLSTRIVYTENNETPSVTTEEPPTSPIHNEYYNNTLYISSEESSTHTVRTEEADRPSVSREETLILPSYTENYDKSTISKDENSTLPTYIENTDSPPISDEGVSTLSTYEDLSFTTNEELTTQNPFYPEKKYSTSVSEKESSTSSAYFEDKISVSLSGEKSSTLSQYSENKDSLSLSREESSTQSTYTENTDSSIILTKQFSTSSVPYTNSYTTTTPTISTISNFPTDYSYTQFTSQEPSTIARDNTYGDFNSSLNEQSIETENSYTPSTSEIPSTLADQTEYTLTYDSNTNVYNPSLLNINDDFSNFTSNEYSDGFSNFTKITTDFESSTEDSNSETNVFTDIFDTNNVTEQQTSETLSAREFIKSRSTNARSVSPNHVSQNHLEMVETISESSKEDQNPFKSDFVLPIRIIMRAPHVDEFHDRSMKAHEYLVLKTGQPDYHEHLESRDDSKNYEEEHEPVRKKSEAIKRTFGKDESPGLYGEVADYWRNLNSDPLPEIAQPDTDEDDDQTFEQETNYTEDDMAFTSSTLSVDDERGNTESIYQNPALVPMEEVDLNNEKIYDHNLDYKEEVDVVDEESKSKLIAHYSKLLPWLYYVLAK